MEYESDGDNCCARPSNQRIDKVTGRLENKRTSGDFPNDNIMKIGQNTKKSPGILRKLSFKLH